MANDHEKELAAPASLAYVRDGSVVGLGTGSTAAPMVRVRAGMKIRGIPTSVQTEKLAISLGIPMTTLEAVQDVDVTIDGADDACVDPGGCAA